MKIHAVALNVRDNCSSAHMSSRSLCPSAQHRDVTIASNTYPAPSQENVVPCSDMAGEVVTIGGNVQKWKVGDRVCANFTLNRVAGNVELEMFSHALGSNDDGVLTEYRIFPEDVGFYFTGFVCSPCSWFLPSPVACFHSRTPIVSGSLDPTVGSSVDVVSLSHCRLLVGVRLSPPGMRCKAESL